MAITDLDKQAIDEAVANLHFVRVNEDGHKSFDPFYTDYHDTNDFLIQKAYDMRHAAMKEPDAYEPENALIYTLQDMISDIYDEQRWDIEDEIMRKAGFEPEDDKAEEQISYLRENYVMEFPFDHYLNQSVLVNVMLATDDERNQDFGGIKQQQEALDGQFSEEDAKEAMEWETGLTLLLQQQGYTMEDLKAVYEDYQEAFYGEDVDRNAKYGDRYEAFAKDHNRFLTSVCQELDNMHNIMNSMTILAKMDLYQFAEMMKPGKVITFPKESMVGIFAPWQGGGSVLEIELEKDLVVSSDNIWDAQLEDAKLDYQYSVDSVYGLVRSCWKDVGSIQDAEPEKKPALSEMIQSAAVKATEAADKTGPAQDMQR